MCPLKLDSHFENQLVNVVVTAGTEVPAICSYFNGRYLVIAYFHTGFAVKIMYFGISNILSSNA